MQKPKIRCLRCKVFRKEDMFKAHDSNPNRKQLWCSICVNKYNDDYYKEKKKDIIEKRKIKRNKVRLELERIRLLTMCIHCGGSDNLIFESINDRYTDIPLSGKPIKTILKNLKNCYVICSNCVGNKYNCSNINTEFKL